MATHALASPAFHGDEVFDQVGPAEGEQRVGGPAHTVGAGDVTYGVDDRSDVSVRRRGEDSPVERSAVRGGVIDGVVDRVEAEGSDLLEFEIEHA